MVDTYAERSELGWTKREAVGGRGKFLRKTYCKPSTAHVLNAEKKNVGAQESEYLSLGGRIPPTLTFLWFFLFF